MARVSTPTLRWRFYHETKWLLGPETLATDRSAVRTNRGSVESELVLRFKRTEITLEFHRSLFKAIAVNGQIRFHGLRDRQRS